MIIRVQTPNGMKKINCEGDDLIISIKEKLNVLIGVETSAQSLVVKNFGEEKIALDDGETIVGAGLKNGDMLLLTVESDAMDVDQGIVLVSQSVETEDVEDPVDVILRNTDGWVKRDKTKYCSHNDNASCNRCISIAPWLIQNHEPWAEQGLKHIPFHAWVKHAKYSAGSNTMVSLQEDTYRIENTGKFTSEHFMKSTATLKRQEYRHVDHVLFEDQFIIDDFLQGWRATGVQRCGYLIGNYVPDKTIPLGIRAKVCSIYEPPQRDIDGRVTLLKDQNEDLIEAILKKLGLQKLGMIWTSISIDDNGQVVPDRELSSPLLGTEVIRMGHLQTKYPNPWNNSKSKKFGSKFVSVLCFGSISDPGSIDIQAYQVSNQCAVLVTENILRPSTNSAMLKVRKSDKNWLYPAINYMDKNEYNRDVLKSADPYLPLSYFLIGVNHGFPTNPKPRFLAHAFPADRFEKGSWEILAGIVRGKTGKSLTSTLLDFQLILFLAKELGPDSDIVEQITIAFQDASFPVNNLQAILKDTLSEHITTTRQETSTSTPTKTSSADSEHLVELMNMGFTIDQAREALQVSNNSLEHAVNYLLSSLQ